MASSIQNNVFPCNVAQELLDKITDYLEISDLRSLALTCKNLYDGVIATLYTRDKHNNAKALFFAARHGRVEVLNQVVKHNALALLDYQAFDIIPGGLGSYFISWPDPYPPCSAPLVRSIVNGHPTVAKMLLELGAKNIEGGSEALLPSGKLLMPVNWVLYQMTQTTTGKVQKQWEQVLKLLLEKGGPASPDIGRKRLMSALVQSVDHRIPVEVTAMLIKDGELDKKDLFASFQYQLGSKKVMSAYNRAKQERDNADPSSNLGRARARLAILRRVIYSECMYRSPIMVLSLNQDKQLTCIIEEE
ncbi:hypothetical protein PG990_009134 [Apiospora arundinis]